VKEKVKENIKKEKDGGKDKFLRTNIIKNKPVSEGKLCENYLYYNRYRHGISQNRNNKKYYKYICTQTKESKLVCF